eukprot:gnl/TRDRNA2_/TRDRNA2_28721_c0_seq2.p1 gnl/TRDRNA2_/TRDRNA2_28721_c0~~gnl/TRDRNA2_/TRDRNA2_28721_c0_seq2.p1  ORF type:complete len:183 (+),score=20.03 gnl/TRDRNA2_/TRDRNA2_28721_c0_seq2:108-656(+)
MAICSCVDSSWTQFYATLAIIWMTSYCTIIGIVMASVYNPAVGAPLLLFAVLGSWCVWKRLTDERLLVKPYASILYVWLAYCFVWFVGVGGALAYIRSSQVPDCLGLARQMLAFQPQKWPVDAKHPEGFDAKPSDLVDTCAKQTSSMSMCPVALLEVLVITPFIVALGVKSKVDSRVTAPLD